MPANLTPEYERAERRYREATRDDEKLAALQEMLSAIPKHKGTEKMQADLKRRLSQLRKAQQEGGHGKGTDPFHVPKGGAGQVALVGPPNVGKSSLVAATTHAEVRVADYPFTTLAPHPGMWQQDDREIELVDMPPLTADHVPPGFMGAVRSADIVCLVAEAGGEALEQVESVLQLFADRELSLRSAPRNELDRSDPRVRSGLIVVNKADLAPTEANEPLQDLYRGQLEVLSVSARTRQGLDAWFQRLWELLAMIRVFAKRPGHPPDLAKPFTLPCGSTVEDLARRIHRDLPEQMKHARIWGAGHRDGQHVHRHEALRDRDIVEIHE